MSFTPEIIQFSLFAIAVFTIVWRASKMVEDVRSKAERDLLHFSTETLISIEKLKAEDDRLLLFCNGNKELIEHRSSRLNGIIESVSKDLRDVQRYLDSTTSYTLRASRKPNES